MNFINICILLILGIILCISASIVILMISIANALHQKNDLEITRIEMNMVPKKEDFDIIDLMITEEVDKYHIVVNEPNGVQYMSDDNISDMEKTILTKILINLSPLQLQKLKYIYNSDKLEDIIYEKVQLAVVTYASELNTNVSENESL